MNPHAPKKKPRDWQKENRAFNDKLNRAKPRQPSDKGGMAFPQPKDDSARASEKLAEENIGQLKTELDWVKKELQDNSEQYHALKCEFNKIKRSKGFRLLWVAWQVIWRLRDPKRQVVEFRQRIRAGRSRLGERIRSSGLYFIKRLFPQGTMGRRLYTQWRTRRGQFVPGFDHDQPLPIETDLRRFIHEVHARSPSHLILLMASTKLIESEGQRSTNLAFEFASRGIPVIFGYWRWHADDWCPQNYLDRGIMQVPVDVIAQWPEMVFRSFSVPKRMVLFEFPHPSFFRVLAEAHASGWIAIYDVVDDWEEFQRVGQADWYDPQFEAHLMAGADAVTVINRRLAEHLQLLGLEQSAILPNGFAPGVERIDRRRDLERGKVTIGYFGYLAAAWYDWQLVSQAAQARPDWRFYLIGYGGEPEGIFLPENVFLLGKKPRSELASYAANWDVAIIPFKDERLAAGADPIKTYEYLAMGLPVVVTGVYPPEGAELWVQRASCLESFVRAIERASSEGRDGRERRKAFAASCAWERRVEALLAMVARGEQGIAHKLALFRGEP